MISSTYHDKNSENSFFIWNVDWFLSSRDSYDFRIPSNNINQFILIEYQIVTINVKNFWNMFIRINVIMLFIVLYLSISVFVFVLFLFLVWFDFHCITWKVYLHANQYEFYSYLNRNVEYQVNLLGVQLNVVKFGTCLIISLDYLR